jgi:DNA-binding transcriptional MocR family regulator
MTIWSPRLVQSAVPLYRRIADQLEQDIESGLLLPGSRLPTQRELARKLGVTVVTVTRAYAEAGERGLLESTVGRGSFVRDRHDTAAARVLEIDLSTNVIAGGEPAMTAALAARIGAVLSTPYGLGGGSERHRAAGATWIAGRRPDAGASRVVVTAGAQQAIFLTLAALLEPGNLVVTEEVTYHWVRSITELLHLRIEGVPMDRHGILPDAFEKLARRRLPKALYITPTLHNPTGIVMPEKRRRDLAAVAQRHGILIIEDDVYGFLAPDAPPAVTSFAPESGVFLTGMGKSLSPALRIGYLLAPPSLQARIESALNANSLFTSPVSAEIAATAIEDGSAARIVSQRREALAARSRLARRIVSHPGGADERSPHLWLSLPARWTSDAFAAAAAARGVRVASAAQFSMTSHPPNAFRISLGAPRTTGELESALRVLETLRMGVAETRAAAAAV